MPMRADASHLKSRLNGIIQATRLAPYALSEVAVQTIYDVSSNALSRLAGREDQVGFDLAQFLQNIRDPGNLEVSGARGSVGILDTIMMGTAEDFEKISDLDPERHLWHQGGKRGDVFKRAVFDYPDIREELARDRQTIWAERTPQWYLMEYGYTGGGEYPDVPAAHFIQSATRADRMVLRLRNAMASLYRGLPRR